MKVQEIREVAEPASQINEVASPWPSSAPDKAISAMFSWYSDPFMIYAWRAAGNTWVQIVPQKGSRPFICGSDFKIVQDNIQFNNVKLETTSGDSQCAPISITSVFRLNQWSSNTANADLNRAFTLHYGKSYILSLPASSSAPSIPHANTVPEAGDWVSYSMGSSGKSYYDAGSIVTFLTEDVIQVWSKTIYSDEGKRSLRQDLKVTDISESKSLQEFNCRTGETRIIQSGYYDSSRREVINAGENPTGWMKIPRGTRAENLYNIVCRDTQK
jgi:hypothetical protein